MTQPNREDRFRTSGRQENDFLCVASKGNGGIFFDAAGSVGERCSLKTLGNLAGFILLIVGAAWALQGDTDIIDRSLLAGRIDWIVVGGGIAAAGLGLLFASNWGRPHGL